MYHYYPLTLLLSVLFFALAEGLCTTTNCTLIHFAQPPTAKDNATHVYYLGNMYNNGVDSNSLLKWAITNINNDMSILPNVKLELYLANYATLQLSHLPFPLTFRPFMDSIIHMFVCTIYFINFTFIIY